MRKEAMRMVEKAIRLYDYARGYAISSLDDEWAIECILDEQDDLWENG